MTSLARWCYQHRVIVLLLWILGLVGVSVVSGAVGNAYSDSFNASGTDSTDAYDLLRKTFPEQSGDVDTIVWKVDSGSVSDPQVQSRILPMLDEVRSSEHVVGVVSPYDPAGAAQISADGTVAYATVLFDEPADGLPVALFKDVVETAQKAQTDGLSVDLGGRGISLSQQQPPSLPTIVGILAAGVVLFLAFSSLLATLVPLIVAVLALGAATGVIGLLSHAMGVSTIATTLAALVGLGVGVDYALFVVTRHRKNLKAGMTVEDSVVRALNTAGRAVLFAGLAVCIALLGLLLIGVELIDGMAVPAAVTVLFTVFAAVTLLPALLGFFKLRVLSRRERRRLAAEGPESADVVEGKPSRWNEFTRRHPALLTGVVAVVVVLLAAPFFAMRMGHSDSGNDPASWTTRKAYDTLSAGFGVGINGPLVVAVSTPAGEVAPATLTALQDALRGTPGVASVAPPVSSADKSTAIIQVIPTTGPQDEDTSRLIDRLRDDVLPPVTANSGVSAHVGGVTATFDDFAEVLTDSFGLFLAVVIALGAILLLIAFRSVFVALMSAVMNVVAVGVTFGVLTALFQWGWLDDLTGFGGAGPIDPTLPVLMTAILFGLSMDYQVFLISRIHEEWTNTGDPTRAILNGQRGTTRVITIAAVIMVLVFCSFALIGERLVAEFGIGLAIAVLFDAFLLRNVLVPALLHLAGRGAWWLPRPVDRMLPHLSVEAPSRRPSTDPAAPMSLVDETV
ncbi:MMPL family transporter [Micromonospora sp. NPDC005215]|uniref:MMPL family transporter n=1 Tax=Micromonospora sp. NPDC005215 TaxID=3157024 RepID=UPI00339E6A40